MRRSSISETNPKDDALNVQVAASTLLNSQIAPANEPVIQQHGQQSLTGKSMDSSSTSLEDMQSISHPTPLQHAIHGSCVAVCHDKIEAPSSSTSNNDESASANVIKVRVLLHGKPVTEKSILAILFPSSAMSSDSDAHTKSCEPLHKIASSNEGSENDTDIIDGHKQATAAAVLSVMPCA